MYLFITKDITGAVEMWKHRPKIDQNGFFKPFINEVGTEVMDNLFSSLLEKGDCVRIEVKIPTIPDEPTNTDEIQHKIWNNQILDTMGKIQ